MSALSQERDDSVPSFNTIVLVEGISDRIAVEALAERRHRNLAAEELDVRRGLERAGFSHDLTRADMERLGFFVCIADLEDELIRALGAASVETVLEAHGDLRSFRTLQKQPAWRGRSTEQQLRRFMGSGGSRKMRYARLLVEALEPANVPRPLDRLLSRL